VIKSRLFRLIPIAAAIAVILCVPETIFSNEKDETTGNLEALRLVARTLDQINLNPCVDIEPRDSIYSGINGMLRTLDPYTQFLDEVSFDYMLTQQKGSFYGIGVSFDVRNGELLVISPIEGSPAWKKGIRAGDVIAEIEGKSAAGITTNEVITQLRGEKGSKVQVGIRREDEPELLIFELVRDKITLDSVRGGFFINPETGYVRLTEFSSTTQSELEQKLEFLSANGMKNLILDLRFNGGGLLKAAEDVSSLFLKKGHIIVTTRGRDKTNEMMLQCIKDGDGDLDAAVGTYQDTNMLWLNDGSGVFSASMNNLGTYSCSSIALGDMNNDGDLDVFIGVDNDDNQIWFNDGTGMFTDSGQSPGQNDHTLGADLGDVNNDGHLDIYYVNNDRRDELWLNDGTGVFTKSSQNLADDNHGLALGDVDGDGDLDVFVANSYYTDSNTLWLNDGTGEFTDSGQELGDYQSFTVALGDLDGNGSLDAFIANFHQSYGNKVLLNFAVEPTATPIPTATPTAGCTVLGCEVIMPSNDFTAGDDVFCDVYVCNPNQTSYNQTPVFVILDVYGSYFFAPSFGEFDLYTEDILPGLLIINVLPMKRLKRILTWKSLLWIRLWN